MAAVVPEQITDENSSEVAAGDAGGPTGTGDAVELATELAEDEDVIAAKLMMLAVTRAKAMGRTVFMPCSVRRTAKSRSGTSRRKVCACTARPRRLRDG